MELTTLPLPSEIWATTPVAAQALILALQERIRELEPDSARPPSTPRLPRHQIRPRLQCAQRRRPLNASAAVNPDTAGVWPPSKRCSGLILRVQ
jgi:hypothetical protein